ncbi:orotidine-5'-phosphate decarboxylase [Helicobacter cetorum]|uniref:Orotidine 5'-phosphate decarboxylase n=1 Tax=Helicobacter cetorum (strain ATCC BAA-540 / CCUG 52418 / MIT 99-5656) TaxID=1163745 RepID=I0EQ20_HELCM|nr:orotidine-5'-phosphate decarboxylase [Helicobacter cetorum]AFI05039.1 orotidine 5'-phosphate decarboxylase [Helicobacter cetorum MIT 99-5656]
MQLCVALDLEEKKDNLSLLKELKGLDLWAKVGLRSFIRDGFVFLDEIKEIDENFKIFLDLKLYDIPYTMANAALECAKLDIDMLTIHLSSGKTAMQTLMQRLNTLKKRPLIMGVSALTSFSEDEFLSVYNAPLKAQAIKLSTIGKESGIDGVVCSVFESLAIKESLGKDFLTLTPGIRLNKSDKEDQERVANAREARENLSDFIVVGRPIYQAKEPREIVLELLKEC